MRKSHFNEQFLMLLGPIISKFFACPNEEKNKPKQQRVCALVLSLWLPANTYIEEIAQVPLISNDIIAKLMPEDSEL
jgi:hypothetical protein